MKITALRLFNVKRFAGRGIAIEGIGDGVNVLCAANEYGKSTSFEALHALFFQPHSGTPADVQRLRPYSGGNPLIEADIATADGRYRLTKQFYGGRKASVTELGSGRLLAQAGEAEAFIADLTRGGTTGPAGLLWVRQGVTGIEKRSRAEEDGEKRVRESLLSSVQGEVEAMTGGRRMEEIVEACNGELLRLVTPTGRPKGGGLYDIAIERHKRLAEEERRLKAEVTALREALDDRAIAQKRLAEIENPEDQAARRSDLERAENAYEAAKAQGDKLKAAEAEMALARNRRDAAAHALAAFREAMTKAAELRGSLSSAEGRRSEARSRRAAAIAAIEKSVSDVQQAETEEEEARKLLARLDAALEARRAAEELAEMRHRLEQAEAARRGLEEGEAALALIAIPDQAIEKLQDLEIKLAGIRAARETGLPTLRMAYRDGSAGLVSLNGRPLPEAEDRSFEEAADIQIAGIGVLTVRANRPTGADLTLRHTEETRLGLLAALGVADLGEARRRQNAAVAKSAETESLRRRLHELAPEGLPRLREEIARRDVLSAGDLELKGDPADVRLAVARAGQRVSDSRNSAREVQPLRSRADDALVQAETECAKVDVQLKRIDETLGPEEERAARDEGLAAEAAEQQAHFAEIKARTEALRRTAPDLESAEAALRRAKSVHEAADQEASKLRETLANLNGQIRARSDDAVEEAWRETSEALAAAAERVRKFETEIAVLTRLRETLQASRSAARDLYLKPVITELRPLLGLLFDDISIVFDETTLLPQTIRRNGQDEDVERLSGGMREQLSVLTRLAFARLLARDGRPAPVILDDALVYSDDDRIERMFDALHRQSRDQQIIIFSCRQRAFAKLGGNILQLAEWRPGAS